MAGPFAAISGALVLAGGATGAATDARAQAKKLAIALIPGLATDAILIAPTDKVQLVAPLKAVFTEGCAPRDLECKSGLPLQGWPRRPVRPPKDNEGVSKC